MSDFSSKIIAHRGESFDAPENTLAAINLAWERGAKAVEIDIRLTADNQIVVIHDEDTFRISGQKLIIDQATLKEIKLLNVGFFKGEQWQKERIPTLREIIKTVPDYGKLIIEIKHNIAIIEKLVFELENSEFKDEQIEIIAFNYDILVKIRQRLPQYKILWLLDLDYKKPAWLVRVSLKQIIKRVKKANLNGVDVWAGKKLNHYFISEIKNSGLLLYAWTVNDPEKASVLLKSGVDGITTDKAYWMKNQLTKS